jgi:hypothetical protein
MFYMVTAGVFIVPGVDPDANNKVRLALFSKNISTLDAGSIPAAVFISAIGCSSSCQAASTINAFSAVLAGPSFNALMGVVIFPSIQTRTGPSSVFYAERPPFFTQCFFSSSF